MSTVTTCLSAATSLPQLWSRPAGTRIAWSCLELRRHQLNLNANAHSLNLPAYTPSPASDRLIRLPYLHSTPLNYSESPVLSSGEEAPATNDVTMDTLVAKYSRPAYAENEGLTEQDELDFANAVPGPSLKFAMPPVAQVKLPSLTRFFNAPPSPTKTTIPFSRLSNRHTRRHQQILTCT